MDINDIVKGGDERIKLKENGLNKYHGNPLLYESVFIHKRTTTHTQIDQIVKAEKYIKAFVKCSALSGKGVKEVFDKAIKIALEEPAKSSSFCSIL